MSIASNVWRGELLGLALSLEEDLLELNHNRPVNETSGTLEVLVQGLARTWRDMGFSQDEISRAFEAGSRDDFDLDPAWLDQRQQKQAWAEANSGRVGKALGRIQSWSAMLAMLAGLTLLIIVTFGLEGIVRTVIISLFAGGIVLAIGTGKFLGWRKARCLAAIKRGAQPPLES
ncbi:hypothetical protein [uncultured Brevundimonas sp.]|uniref:hypothetical protein n=1 Tax=uncultured Brevundimonas sp. TaxID=213418 RepID=UPI0025D4BA2E|nr:hypothetical protein [uncultured Brevundimonas sp.]